MAWIFSNVSSGSRAPLPEPSPLRTGRADCSASGSSLCRSVSHPLVMLVMAPPVQKASLGGAEDPVLDAPYGGLRRSPVHAGPRHRLSPVGLFGSQPSNVSDRHW